MRPSVVISRISGRVAWRVMLAFVMLATVVFGAWPGQSARAAHVSTVTLTPIGTPFNSPIGIDHHEPTNKLVMSVNYPSGSPYNFELVASDGSRVQFSTISGLTDEVKIATVRTSANMGGFTAGELFTGTGVGGQIRRIAPDGLSSSTITLPGEGGLMRGSLFQDRYGVAGGDLIAVTTAGNVWRVTSGGVGTLLASLGTHLEGVTTVPSDPAMYGPWAGMILAGAEGQGRIYAIAPDGSSTAFYTLGINPEDFDIVPANENFFGVNFSGSSLMGAPASAFADKVGHVVIAQEFPGHLWDVYWDAVAGSFHVTLLATVAQWEHVTFSPAGVLVIPPVDTNDPPDCSAAGPSISLLWPPNHKFVSISVMGVSDPDSDPVSIMIDSIWQDEPVNTVSDGNTSPDGMGVGTDTAQVRAERSGNKSVPGNGRVYHIGFTADDGNGGNCSGEVLVGVPHDQGKGSAPVDGGALYDSTIP